VKELAAQLKKSSPQLSVGTLTADMMNQGAALDILEGQEIPLLHVDVMDGHVWPNFTVGPGFVAGLKTDLLKDIHLLIKNPEKHIANFANAGAGLITFCVEYTESIGNTLTLIEEAGSEILRGVSLNPETPLDIIEPYLDQIDVVLLLAVGPKTGKESFLHTIPAKIETLRKWKPDLLIFIDGSVKKDNIGEITQMGPDFIVTGSAVFDGNDAAKNLQDMKQSIAASQ